MQLIGDSVPLQFAAHALLRIEKNSMHPYQLTEDELLDVIGVNVRPSSRPPRYAEEDQLDDGRDDDGEPEELNFD